MKERVKEWSRAEGTEGRGEGKGRKKGRKVRRKEGGEKEGRERNWEREKIRRQKRKIMGEKCKNVYMGGDSNNFEFISLVYISFTF